MIIAADCNGSRLLIAVYRPRQPAPEAAKAIAPDVTLEPVGDYVMISCSVPPGTEIPPAAQWTDGTPAMLRDAMLASVEGRHPAAHAMLPTLGLGANLALPCTDLVFDHSAAFAAWGPVVLELGQVHAADERLRAAYRVAPGAISHVSWVVPDLERESARMTAA